MAQSSLAGKVAVITGASSGIGAAAARAFAAEGCHVVLAARSEAKLHKLAEELQGTKVKALPVACDVRSPEEVQALGKAVKGTFGRCDVLVNNAGVGIGGEMLDMEQAHFDETFEVNVRGPWLVAKALVPLMPAGGTVLNIASVAGKEGAASLGAYCASKAALRVMSEAMGREWAARGIRVVCVNPGYVATPMVDDAGIAMEDMVRPQELALVLVMLTTQPGSVYMDAIDVWPRKLYDS